MSTECSKAESYRCPDNRCWRTQVCHRNLSHEAAADVAKVCADVERESKARIAIFVGKVRRKMEPLR